MDAAIDERVHRCIGDIYDAAVGQVPWSRALEQVSGLFDAGFADICTWTHDRRYVNGLVHGLDHDDYHDNFLGRWFNRNVWSSVAPARVPGEVLSTRTMMPREDLRRSEMYHAFLHPRGLHEGLRLTLWSDETGMGDVSLLRPWSGGAYGPAEVALGRSLLPHLQRAVAVTRRLRAADFRLAAAQAGDSRSGVAAIAFDAGARPCWFNAAALQALEAGTPLRLAAGDLQAATPRATRDLARVVARSIGQRVAGAAMLPRAPGLGNVNVVVVPLSTHRDDWSLPRPPAAVALLRPPDAGGADHALLRSLFGLTPAEGELARDLLAGATVGEVARRTGRTAATLRTHLARLFDKTGTGRQVDLVRLLDQATAFRTAPEPAPPPGDPFSRPVLSPTAAPASEAPAIAGTRRRDRLPPRGRAGAPG